MAEKTPNTIAQLERTIAWTIRGDPAVSGIFNGADVPVYCATDEDFGEKLQSDIQGALGQTIRVAYAGRENIRFQQPGVLIENGRINVTITSPVLMANDRPESAISLADAVDAALTGTVFTEPFTSMPVIVASSNYELNEAQMRFEATLSLRIQFFLTRRR